MSAELEFVFQCDRCASLGRVGLDDYHGSARLLERHGWRSLGWKRPGETGMVHLDLCAACVPDVEKALCPDTHDGRALRERLSLEG